jgi:uncharacterized protein
MSDTQKRIPIIHNCHTHVFTIHQIPDTVHPAIRYLRNEQLVRFLRGFIKIFNPFINIYLTFFSPARIGLALRFMALLDIGTKDSSGKPVTQELVFKRLKGAYPKETKFVILPLDMDYISGTYQPAPQDYVTQLEELRQLRDSCPKQVIPFICADPRRADMFELVKKYIEEHHFAGIKLYPPIGFFPTDPRLDELYAWAEEKQIPILTHCTTGGIYTRVLPENCNHPQTGEPLLGRTPAQFAPNYSRPQNYDAVLEKYPKLKLCLAHLGGGSECRKFLDQSKDDYKDNLSWTAIIIAQMRRYCNVYSDLSYTGYDRDLLPFFKVLANTDKVDKKLLFGSDYFVVRAEATEREFSIRLRGFLGEQDYWKIAEENPKNFLANNISG